MEKIDCLVAGQGLAGTALTWALLERGKNVHVVDDADGHGASRVAAGLLTPLAGRRLGPVDGYDDCFVVASAHYKAIEQHTGQPFFRAAPAVRLLHTQDELDHFASRRSELGATVADITQPIPAGLNPGIGGFELPGAARLDVPAYLDASRAAFIERGIFHTGRIKPATIGRSAAGLDVHCESLFTQQLFFCGGFADARNPWLPGMAFAPAKGELLEIRLPGFTEQRTVHSAHGWLIPTQTAEIYRFGATYDHADLTPGITQDGRARLIERLGGLITLPLDILAQYGAVRPIGALREPVLGRHPQEKRIAFLNGLGSRGALWAPWLASALSDFMLDEQPLVLPMRPAAAPSAD